MTDTQERARWWVRVSGSGQKEANQIPDIRRWSDTRNYLYDETETYVVHAKSALHKKQQADLDRAISDMANKEYDVLVVWAFDRLQRPTTLDAFILAEQARQAGGRIEYVQDEYLNSANVMSDVLLAMAATLAREESKRKSARVKIKHDELRANGSAVNKAPWGCQIICDVCGTPPEKPGCKDHRKLFAPTPDGQKYIPAIYDLVIDGNSLRRIADWLNDEGAGGKIWNSGYIADLLKNPAYYGAPRNAGQMQIVSLVGYTVWQQANAALTARAKLGRGAHDKALQRPECGNPECDATGEHPSPMYRIGIRGGHLYYRCAGRGPQKKGCGNMVPLEVADEWVTGAMLSDRNPHPVRIFVAGDARADEIGRLRERAVDAYMAGHRDVFERLDAEANELSELPSTPPHWETFYICHTCGRVQDIAACLAAGHEFNTNADHFTAMSLDERRDELGQRWRITLTRDAVGMVPRELS